MISNREKIWHYHAVKKLSALLRGITSKHHSGFYCLNCLHSCAVKELSALLRGITSKHHSDFYCLNCLHSFALKKYVKIKIFATS